MYSAVLFLRVAQILRSFPRLSPDPILRYAMHLCGCHRPAAYYPTQVGESIEDAHIPCVPYCALPGCHRHSQWSRTSHRRLAARPPAQLTVTCWASLVPWCPASLHSLKWCSLLFDGWHQAEALQSPAENGHHPGLLSQSHFINEAEVKSAVRRYSLSSFPCAFLSGYLSGYPLERQEYAVALSQVAPVVALTYGTLDLHGYRYVRRAQSGAVAVSTQGMGRLPWVDTMNVLT